MRRATVAREGVTVACSRYRESQQWRVVVADQATA